ncbi:MAG: VOC family protein [Pseudomonadota bacterium]
MSGDETSSDEKPSIDGRNTVTAYLCVRDAAGAIDFYKKAFGATQATDAITMPDGKIGHAELHIGNSKVMLSDEFPDWGANSPSTLGGSPVTLMLTVPDADDFVEKAVQEGAEIIRPVENQFYGERSGQILDPFGFKWGIGTPVETVSPEELKRRAKELFG